MSIQPANIANLTMEISIDAAPERVWRALTEQIGAWWPNEFYAGGNAGSRDFHIEAHPGGRMFESWDDGGGVLWGTVVTVKAAQQLQVLGAIFPNWGGPVQSYATWDLEAAEDGTLLKFDEHMLGNVSAAGLEDKDKGWTFLWAALKAHVEGSNPPQWVD